MTQTEEYNLRKEIFTVPNILVYIRIALIPVFVLLYLYATRPAHYYLAFAVMVIAFLTDFFDGKIARRFNQVTVLGKIIDPIADKLYQFSVALCIVVQFPQMIVIAVLLFVKEISMGIMGLVLISKGGKVFSAKWYGKFCTGFVDITMVLFLISPLVDNLPYRFMGWLIVACGIILVIVSVLYTRLFAAKIRELD